MQNFLPCRLRGQAILRSGLVVQKVLIGSYRQHSHVSELIQEGDRALLQYRGDDPFLTPELQRHGTINTRWGSLPNSALLGKSAREVVTTNKGRRLGVRFPTLSEYVTLTPRLVTPIYPADANFIVSLLDIHTVRGTPVNPLQIMEAGTGHGALTLHLARAISGANRVDHAPCGDHPPSLNRTSLWRRLLCRIRGPSRNTSSQPNGKLNPGGGPHSAIVHTIDVSSKHSDHARKIVQGFRRGMYAGSIEFHIGNVAEWLECRLEERRRHGFTTEDMPFLQHAFLDLPNSHRHLEKVASALKTNGALIALNPSITQIAEGVEMVKKQGLPLALDRVLELGPTMTGGKEWDVRVVNPKKTDLPQQRILSPPEKGPTQNHDAAKGLSAAEEVVPGIHEDVLTEVSGEADEEAEKKWAMVCRPKVGLRITGGAFIGVWKKMRIDHHA